MGAAALPNSEAFVIPLILRLAAMLFNRDGWNRLRRKVAQNPGEVPNFTYMWILLMFAGATWAFTILPMLIDPVIHPARLAVGGTVIMGVGIIVNLLAPIRSCAVAFSIGYVAAFGIGLSLAQMEFALILFLSSCGLIVVLLAYSFATTREKLLTARTIVDNRRLEVALEKSLQKAEYLATRDPLTGMLNRRAFFESYEALGTENSDVAPHLFTIDMDHFKQINDKYGHETGDKVLIAVAEQIRDVLRDLPGAGHRACRFGGEEFVAITLGVDRITAKSVAEALRARIAQSIHAATDGTAIQVSASIGLAQMGHGESIDNAVHRSDLAMYRAKDRGRDKVETAA